MATGREKRRKRRPAKGVKPDNPAQSKRFIEAAKELGVDLSEEAFDKALSKVLKPKEKKRGSN